MAGKDKPSSCSIGTPLAYNRALGVDDIMCVCPYAARKYLLNGQHLFVLCWLRNVLSKLLMKIHWGGATGIVFQSIPSPSEGTFSSKFRDATGQRKVGSVRARDGHEIRCRFVRRRRKSRSLEGAFLNRAGPLLQKVKYSRTQQGIRINFYK